jgi:hypothetical protein
VNVNVESKLVSVANNKNKTIIAKRVKASKQQHTISTTTVKTLVRNASLTEDHWRNGAPGHK